MKETNAEYVARHQANKIRSNQFSQWIIGILLIIGVLWVGNALNHVPNNTAETATPQNSLESSPVVTPTIEVQQVKGTYLNYKYTILTQKGDSHHSAEFSPFLARNDGVLKGAMAVLINETYGKHTVSDLEPKLIERNGVVLITIEAVDGKYYFDPIKEDTGEIHTLLYWKE